MTKESGFTLLDLMTAMAVAAVLVTVAVPGLQSITASSRQTGSVNELVSAVHIARSTAVTQNARSTLCASADGTACDGASWADGFIVFRDNDGDQAVDGDDTIVHRGPAIESLTVTAADLGTAFTYRSNGRTTLPANGLTVGSLSFCDSRGQKHARGFAIDLSGQPRVLPQGDAALSC